MSEHPRELHFVVDIDGCLSREFCGDDQRSARHHDGELNDQLLPALDATVDANTIPPSGLSFSDCCVEKFRHANSVHDSMLVNSHFCPLNLEEFHSVVRRTESKGIRRGDACEHFELTSLSFIACSQFGTPNAARGRGIPLAALVHATGASRNHTNSNHAKTTASAIPAAIASIRANLSDIRNSFGFALQSKDSNLRPCLRRGDYSDDSAPRSHGTRGKKDRAFLLSLTASPKAFATISVAHPMLAKASGREFLVGQL
jgi:hypothetical protein